VCHSVSKYAEAPHQRSAPSSINVPDELTRGKTPSNRTPKSPPLGRLARQGHQVVQFLDRQTRRFVAVAIDGKVKEYGGMRRDSDR
jgi:hypothetical protein